jgi:hypothetical protein
MIDDPGEPPEFRDINPMMLNNRELLEVHHKLAEWEDDVSSARSRINPFGYDSPTKEPTALEGPRFLHRLHCRQVIRIARI